MAFYPLLFKKIKYSAHFCQIFEFHKRELAQGEAKKLQHTSEENLLVPPRQKFDQQGKPDEIFSQRMLKFFAPHCSST
jgi:hypothetical protein